MEKLLVISSYPGKGSTHHSKTVGIASYAKNTLLGIKKAVDKLEIEVLAEVLEGQEKEYEDEGMSVKRVWKRNSLSSYFKLFKESINSKSKHVMIEFEVSMFGGIIKTIPFPFFILALRLFGKNVTIVVHQAISDLSEFEGHTNVGGLKAKILSLGLNIFYLLLTSFSSKIIIFEQSLKSNLPKTNKVVVIPHGVEDFGNSKANSDLKLPKNKKIILLFGYIAWYKGTDWAVEEFKKLANQEQFKDFVLVIAGGPNPNHKEKKYYMDYVDSVISNANNENIIYTGFIKEEDIQKYYQAAYLVILPYRNFMSASGPLSIAYSFGKPAMVSEKLKSIFENSDIKKLIGKLNLKPENLYFSLNSESFEKALRTNDEQMEKITKLSKELKEVRSFKTIGKEYYEQIFSK